MTLTKAQRKHLEARLQDERARALQLLNQSVEESAEDTEARLSGEASLMPTHPADLGTDTMQRELYASNATRISQELGEIDAALERLLKTPEKFGICEDTGSEIAFERLDIIPWARTCGGTG